jgi:hypothetical protein
VAHFWLIWVVLFAYLYEFVYDADLTLFTVQHPAFVQTATLVRLPIWVGYYALAQFLTYSASISTAISFPSIASNSLIVSILNVIEAVGSILFTALVVATFVGKALSSRRK